MAGEEELGDGTKGKKKVSLPKEALGEGRYEANLNDESDHSFSSSKPSIGIT
jgi:hypothetical protein